jgi:release factor glutamine methyltransferase
VARAQVRTLPKEIRDHEPRVSLSDNSHDGLGMVNRLATETTQWLKPGGWLLIEVSPDLSRAVGSILRRAGFQQVRSERDSLGATRVISGRLAASGRRTGP